MKHSLVFLLLIIATTLFAQPAPQKYSRVKVFLHDTHITELAELGLEYDHGYLAKDKFWINDVSSEEIAILKANNLKFEVLIEDVSQWYADQSQAVINKTANARNSNVCNEVDLTLQYETPTNYTYGSMGGYHTYAELLVVLDDMKAKFPNLISEKQPIGNYLTHGSRPIYWLKVGVNPEVDEDKPAILYNALHHAREPNSLAQMLFFMWYLLENYETNEEVKYIMENVEMYFIPCINPDGYIYNERTNPNGGGLWRKNRWVNGQGDTVGVDLNRNYGFNWGLDDSGSSPNQSSELYRGIAPFSEPETEAVKDFCIQHEFKLALNYHCFSNLLIIPWGFNNTLTPDDATFRAIGNKLTEQNNYFIGTGLETVGYIVNGDSDDWMYGEQTVKPKIISMTPEVGPQLYGFWPPASAIDQLNKDNLWQNLSAAAVLKPYGEVIDNNPNILAESEGLLNFELQNIGLESGEFTITVNANNDAVLINLEPQGFSINHLEKKDFSIEYVITDSDIRNFEFDIVINNGTINRTTTIKKKYFPASFEPAFTDNIEATLTNWTANRTWGTTDRIFYSENYSITDSPNGNYPDMASYYVQNRAAIDLTDALAAMVKFRGKWELEPNFDYVQFLISTDQSNFEPLCGAFSVQNGRQEPAYNGFQKEWVLEEIDLTNYIGQKIFFRFQLDSDDFVNEDGFYFDDFEVEVIRGDGTTSTSEPLFIGENSIQVMPNPFKESFSINFELKEKVETLTLKINNPLGQEVAVRQLENLGMGRHTYEWQNLNLDNGIYFIQLQNANGQTISKKILKLE